ncbi:recombinase family protein [Mycolicibacterium sediminis]|nr:recombinase family protein [Mycolicibacterium sediminis]
MFTDHGVSGSPASRPQLDACLNHLRRRHPGGLEA